MSTKIFLGHFYSILVILIWGLTFVSSKVLLEEFSPIEILFDRSLLATLALLCFAPKALKFISFKAELYSILCGIYGVTLYFVFENNALIYSNSSNVAMIVSTAPFFVAFLQRFVDPSIRLTKDFIVGFIIAIVGIGLLSLGTLKLELNPIGDILALGAAMCWGGYNLYFSKLHLLKIDTLTITAKSFFYATVCTIPLMVIKGYEIKLDSLLSPINAMNFIFLAVLASSLSFMLWNLAITYLGAVKTNVYLYGQTAVTAVFAVILIDEKLSVYSVVGMALAIFGLVLSQKFKQKTK